MHSSAAPETAAPTASLDRIHALLLHLTEQQHQTFEQFNIRLAALEQQIQQLQLPKQRVIPDIKDIALSYASPAKKRLPFSPNKSFSVSTPDVSSPFDPAIAAAELLKFSGDLETCKQKVTRYQNQGGKADQLIETDEKDDDAQQTPNMLIHLACVKNPRLAEAFCELDPGCIRFVDQHNKIPLDYCRDVTLYKALLKQGAKVSGKHGENILFDLARSNPLDLEFMQDLLVGKYEEQTWPLRDLVIKNQEKSALDVLLSSHLNRNLTGNSLTQFAKAVVLYLRAGMPFDRSSFTYGNFNERLSIAQALFDYIIQTEEMILPPELHSVMTYHAIEIAHCCCGYQPSLTEQLTLLKKILSKEDFFLRQLIIQEDWDDRCSPREQLQHLATSNPEAKHLNDDRWPRPRRYPPQNTQILVYLTEHFNRLLQNILIDACSNLTDESKSILTTEPFYRETQIQIPDAKFVGTALDYAFTQQNVPVSILLLLSDAVYTIPIIQVKNLLQSKDMPTALFDIIVSEYKEPQEPTSEDPKPSRYFKDKYLSLSELPRHLYLVLIAYKTELQELIITKAMAFAKTDRNRGIALLDFCLLGGECQTLNPSRQSLLCQIFGTPRDNTSRTAPKFSTYVFEKDNAAKAFKALGKVKLQIAAETKLESRSRSGSSTTGLFSQSSSAGPTPVLSRSNTPAPTLTCAPPDSDDSD